MPFDRVRLGSGRVDQKAVVNPIYVMMAMKNTRGNYSHGTVDGLQRLRQWCDRARWIMTRVASLECGALNHTTPPFPSYHAWCARVLTGKISRTHVVGVHLRITSVG